MGAERCRLRQKHQELVSLGVRFIAITQNLDTEDTNPMARFLLHILAAFAELERELIRERVTEYGRRKPREAGRVPQTNLPTIRGDGAPRTRQELASHSRSSRRACRNPD